MKISEKLICIPPHISTTWDQITFLYTEQDTHSEGLVLVLHLQNGNIVRIPHLDASIIDIAFAAHIKYLESQGVQKESPSKSISNLIQNLLGMPPDQIASIPIRFGIGGLSGGMEGLESAFQHNASQGDIPNLPPEVIEKITSMARLITNGDIGSFPKPEPHCNCMHCQVARSIHGNQGEKEGSQKEQEETVTEEDLRFRNWDIQQTGDKLYLVKNPLDAREQYNVYLGTPVGCTCGQSHCEHIKAVLNS